MNASLVGIVGAMRTIWVSRRALLIISPSMRRMVRLFMGIIDLGDIVLLSFLQVPHATSMSQPFLKRLLSLVK